MRSIIMLRLGGAHVAEFTHRSLSLLSITTIRRNTVLQPLIVSLSAPTLVEIENNITLCHSGLHSESGLAGINNSDNLTNDMDLGSHIISHARSGRQVVHQVLMFDKLAIEQHVRWDDSTNKFLGICCEHSHHIPLKFTSERELDILCDAIGEKKVHLASEATVAGIGALSEIPHEYSVRPIMFAGTCKRETDMHHARVIQTVLDAANNVNTREGYPYHTVCIASDGEAKRGDALVILTMSSQLSTSLPIYAQLSSLKLMNHLVSPDDITADKDFKHILKHVRNLLMHLKGVLIQGFCITPTILQMHLKSHSVPPH